MNYKVSDLVKRAKQLADLEGTDFISWNENINLLNENYVDIYQKMINAGEKSFLKSFYTSSGEVELPKDFYQLKGVFLYNNGNLVLINRRAENQNLNALSYEIKNNKLIVYGGADNVYVEYFEKPKHLTFKPNDIEIDLESKNYLDCYGHSFLYEDTNESENETLSIIDLDGYKTQKDILQITHADIEKAFIREDFVVVITADSTIIYSITDGISATLESGVPMFTEDGNFYILDDNKIKMVEITEQGEYTTVDVKGMEEFNDGDSFYVMNNEMTDFYYIKDNVLYHNGKNLNNFIADKLAYKDGMCYFLRPLMFGKIVDDKVISLDQNPGKFIGFTSLDDRTGFGYVSKLFGRYFVKPFVEDVELNYPNSFFYKILSYSLAIAYKIKQGADISGLSAQLQSVENTFIDTLGEDSFSPPRMTNVY